MCDVLQSLGLAFECITDSVVFCFFLFLKFGSPVGKMALRVCKQA